MRKHFKAVAALLCAAAMMVSVTACGETKKEETKAPVETTVAAETEAAKETEAAEKIEVTPTYSLVQNVYSWGSSYSKIIVPADFSQETSLVNPADYKVSVERFNKAGEPLNSGSRVVTAAYRSDEKGYNDDNGNYVTLDLAVTGNLGVAQPYYNDPESFGSTLKAWADCKYTVENTAINYVWDTVDTVYHPDEEKFTTDSFTDGDVTIPYAYYGVEDSADHPLVVWLHGAGSGGTDIGFVTGGMLVTNFVSDEVQEIFGGANILLPQCETVWMDAGNGEYTTDGTSMYTESLMALINKIAEEKNVDKSKIYVGGCSNGGYMTVELARKYPETFAACFPICQAMDDTWVTDEDITALTSVPMWLVHCTEDPVVDCGKTSEPLYTRLNAAGAENLHFTKYEAIVDPDYGNTYIGHFAWVYSLKNLCDTDYDGSKVVVDGNEVTIYEWLATCSK